MFYQHLSANSKNTFFAKCCVNFLAFFPLMSFLHKNVEKTDFNQRLECTAPKCWSKYTTLVVYKFFSHPNKISTHIFHSFSLRNHSLIRECQCGQFLNHTLPCKTPFIFYHLCLCFSNLLQFWEHLLLKQNKSFRI